MHALLLGAISAAACRPATSGHPGTTVLDGGPATDAGRLTCAPPLAGYTVVHANAFGAEWLPDRSRLAFNRPDSDGLYHIFTMLLDGGEEARVGAGSPAFPQKTTGSPNYHPSGKYFAFVAEKVDGGSSSASTPGWGSDCDVWLATADATQTWQITNLPSGSGVVLPVFSPDGAHLQWAERTGSGCTLVGCWQLKVADFIDDPVQGPLFQNIRVVSPDTSAFNESGGFSPDGLTFVFTSSSPTHNFFESQTIQMDLATLTPQVLTSGTHATNGTPSYNEHPRYTANGQITWMTNVGATLSGEDWWIMNGDGSSKTRLSFFNEPGSDINGGKAVYPGPIGIENWTPDRSAFYGDVELNATTGESVMVRAQLTCTP